MYSQNMCNCITNYVNDPNLGCRRNDEMTKATSAVSTVAVSTKTNTVAGTTMAKVTDKPTVRVTQTTVTRPNVITLPPKSPTAAPTNVMGGTTTKGSNAVAVVFEIAVALLAVIALLI
jgi:hypothetical protein